MNRRTFFAFFSGLLALLGIRRKTSLPDGWRAIYRMASKPVDRDRLYAIMHRNTDRISEYCGVRGFGDDLS